MQKDPSASGKGDLRTNRPPCARIKIVSTYGAIPFIGSFDGSRSQDWDGNITNYHWDFGDGNSDTGVSVNHEFTTAGDYTVTLTVTDDYGDTSSASTN